jgi:hypothetical protein
MRIRVRQRPTTASVDRLRLDRFEPGYFYDVGTSLGCLLLSEGWAEPVAREEPALLVPLRETAPSSEVPTDGPQNLLREMYPPDIDGFAVATDANRRKRRP